MGGLGWFCLGGILGMLWALILVDPLIKAINRKRNRG